MQTTGGGGNSTTPAVVMMVCDFCQTPSTQLLRCTRCKSAYYCNQTCQLGDWEKRHSSFCIPRTEEEAASLTLPLSNNNFFVGSSSSSSNSNNNSSSSNNNNNNNHNHRNATNNSNSITATTSTSSSTSHNGDEPGLSELKIMLTNHLLLSQSQLEKLVIAESTGNRNEILSLIQDVRTTNPAISLQDFRIKATQTETQYLSQIQELRKELERINFALTASHNRIQDLERECAQLRQNKTSSSTTSTSTTPTNGNGTTLPSLFSNGISINLPTSNNSSNTSGSHNNNINGHQQQKLPDDSRFSPSELFMFPRNSLPVAPTGESSLFNPGTASTNTITPATSTSISSFLRPSVGISSSSSSSSLAMMRFGSNNNNNNNNNNSNDDDDKYCIMCMSVIPDVLAIPCMHMFCKSCVVQWRDRGHSDCPVCFVPFQSLNGTNYFEDLSRDSSSTGKYQDQNSSENNKTSASVGAVSSSLTSGSDTAGALTNSLNDKRPGVVAGGKANPATTTTKPVEVVSSKVPALATTITTKKTPPFGSLGPASSTSTSIPSSTTNTSTANSTATNLLSSTNSGDTTAGRESALSKTRWKSVLCERHKIGKCPYTKKECHYAHGPSDLRLNPGAGVLPPNPRPNISKTVICEHWKAGKCRYTRETCPFAHGESDLNPRLTDTRSQQIN